MADGIIYAHSLPGAAMDRWESLSDHQEAVAALAAEFAAVFGWAEAARLAGRLHDIGKLSAAFQAYIAGQRESGGDHSSAGARIALDAYNSPLGTMLAAIIAAHHAGLADGVDLARRLEGAGGLVPAGWRAQVGPLPPQPALGPARPFDLRVGRKGFAASFLVRMLFSCLVDADFLATERFYAEAEGVPVERGGHTGLAVLRDRLRAHMAEKRAEAEPTPLNVLRAAILDHTIRKAELTPGLFTLTVPTGGGKTLASLSFALEHAVRHGLRRVVYVIPYTSIIEQTAEVFRRALGSQDDILEHHASFDWERARRTPRADDEAPDAVSKLQWAAENWDVPIVVTTAVQFFESLFADRPSRCRKLHNIAGSVVVLDEAQTMPMQLLRPCMAAIDELARHYGASIVLCTATQPALRVKDGFEKGGFAIDDTRELAPDPQDLYRRLKRVAVERISEPVADAVIADRFAEQPQMLCIVNRRQHAQLLFAAIRDLPGAVHLSTLMCPRHRRQVLAGLRDRLRQGQPVRLVATSLIEAGVDIDFPEVWRAAAGIDSIAQAAGRCNREGVLTDGEGRPRLGRVVVFEPAEATAPHDLKVRWQAAQPALAKHADPLGLDAVRDFFGELYWRKSEAALDAAKVGGIPGVLAAIRERAADWAFPFASIAQAFRLIDEVMEPAIVPWRADDADREADELLARIAAAQPKPSGRDLRRLQQYAVPIPRDKWKDWLARGVLTQVHPALGGAMLRFVDLAHYRPDTGVDLEEPTYRDAEWNVF
ncbi:CRISPR-associated endonuclease Cas3'' [Inquilinus sp. Marseille-Q2685]|uniref:CRISPR-associated endonuclease Cas3'' n=1 Tax=Inquilinus sp. Marseille-Q2685 TaxID=2866581 RepID=UPI001CE43882|nr:CRISPR-associated endonuclease Cas3'' [Inquilinus sp. Marseille-Q2685]